MCFYLFKVLVLMDDKTHGGLCSSFTGERKRKGDEGKRGGHFI